MRLVWTGALLAAGVVAGQTLARRVAARRTGGEAARWLAVTVNAPLERVVVALAGFAPETRLTPAPGGRGTEVAARPAGTGSEQDVRRALRDLKAVVETGEVLRPDEPATGKPTPGGALVRLATRRAGGEGRL